MKKILKKYRVTLQTQFIVFTSVTFTLIFLILAFAIYQNQKINIIESNEARMFAHVKDLTNTINIYYEEKVNVLKNAGKGVSKMLTLGKSGLSETDSMMTISAKSFNKKDPLNYNSIVDVTVKQWLYQGEQLQNGDHSFVDTQGETLGGLVTIFQHTDKGELVIQSNLYFDGKNRSENVLVNEEVLSKSIAGEEIIDRVKIIDKWALALYKPIIFNNDVKGIMFIGIHENIIERISSIFNETTYFNTGYPFVFNSDRRYLVHPYLKGDTIHHVTDIASLKTEKQGKLRYLHENKEGKKIWKWMYYQYYQPYDMFISASVDEEEFLNKPLIKTRNVIFIGLLIALTIGITGIYFLVKTITQPINNLKQKLQELALGKSVVSNFTERKDEIGDIAKAVDKVVGGVNTASAFASEIGNENYDAFFEPLSEEDLLGNALLNMKNNLKVAKEDREQRTWINLGLTEIGNILREKGQDIDTLSDAILIQIIKYLNANQGALYIVNEDAQGKEKLVLQAYYAWGRKKYLKQEILPGEGQVGQIWLEKEYIYIENIPDNYVNISSGLGEAAPRMVLIVPIKLNEKVFGVIEIASFNKLKEYHIQFVNKIAENIASTLSSAKTNIKTQQLLRQTQEMTEVLRAQEEEMRQNVEELQATHEEVSRREQTLKIEVEKLKLENQELKNKKEG